MNFSNHYDMWKGCTSCPLYRTRTKVVLARGTVPCDVLFVGEAPGASEDVIGQPFVGPAGKLLDRIIGMSIGERKYALTNIIACIPIDEDGDKVHSGSDIPAESIEACAPRLDQFIDIAKPGLIVAVGSFAEKQLDVGITVVGIIHPAAILRMDVSQRGLAVQRSVVAISDAVEELAPF